MQRLVDKAKRIPWDKFFKIDNPGMITLRVTPDRTADNRQNYKLIRALHEMYQAPLSRIGFGKWFIRYAPKAQFWYDIVLTKDEIRFYFTVPSSWETYAKQKISGCWPRASVDHAEPNELTIPLEHTKACELMYKRHNIFALRVDRTEDTQPLSSLMAASRDMGEGDKARLSLCADPVNRMNWQDQSEQAHKQFAQGKTPQRRGFSKRKALLSFGTIVEGIFEQLSEVLLAVLGHDEDKVSQGKQMDLEKRQILIDGKLGSATREKRNEPTFNTHIWVSSYSTNDNRREITSRALSNAFQDVAGDNELEPVEIKNKKAAIRILCEINMHKLGSRLSVKSMAKSATVGAIAGATACYLAPTIPKIYIIGQVITKAGYFKLATSGALGGCVLNGMINLGNGDTNIMSASEIGKLAQLPGAGLQDDYADQLETIKLRQDGPPASVCKDGIYMGQVEQKNGEISFFKPVNNQDDLCYPDVAIGAPGTGKTKGQAANTAVEAVLQGFSAVAIDPAKRELGCEVAVALPPEKVNILDLSKIKIGLDWREADHSQDPNSLLAESLLMFFNMDGSEVQTERFLFAAVMAMQTRKLAELQKIFENEKYRAECISKMPDDINKTTLGEFGQCSPDRRRAIMAPIYNRLSILLRNRYLSACLEEENGLDFCEIMKERGKVTIIDIPADAFPSKQARDLLVNLISTKIDIAMRLRKDEDIFPYFVIMDEPHQYLRSAKIWEAAAVEARKYRIKYCWYFHSLEQLPAELSGILLDAGPHLHIYRSSERTYKALKHYLEPYTLDDVTKMPRHYAINVIRADGETTRPFMAHMAAPPSMRFKLMQAAK